MVLDTFNYANGSSHGIFIRQVSSMARAPLALSRRSADVLFQTAMKQGENGGFLRRKVVQI